MLQSSSEETSRFDRRVPVTIATATVAAIATIVIAGWIFDVEILKSLTGSVTMKFNAAAGLLLLSVVLAVRTRRPGPGLRFATAIALVTVLIVAGDVLVANMTGTASRLDQLIVQDRGVSATPGRMASLTACCLALLALVLWTIEREGRALSALRRVVLGVTATITAFVIIGHAYGIAGYQDVTKALMAVHTAVALLLLSLGAASASAESRWFELLFVWDGLASRLARRTIFVSTILLLVLGGLRIAGERAGLFSSESGVAMMITTQVSVTALLVIGGASLLEQEARSRRSRELALIESDERFRLITRATNDATYDWDIASGQRIWNQNAQERLGVAPLDGGRDTSEWLERIHPDDRERISSDFREALAGTVTDWSAEYRRRGTSGDWIDVFERCYIVRAGDGRAVRAVGALSDVTILREAEQILRDSHGELERRVEQRTADVFESNRKLQEEIALRATAQEELRRERDFMKAISNTSAALIVVMDEAGRIVRFNRACERLTGWSEEEVRGRLLADVLLPPADLGQSLAPVRNDEYPNANENAWITRDGRARIISWRNDVLADESSDKTFVIATGIDVTEERAAQEELIHSRDRLAAIAAELNASNRELEAFSYSVSHDLRAPLRALDGFSQALHEDYATVLDETGKDYLDRIRGATRRMDELIDGLLTLARVTRAGLDKQPVDLSTIAAEIIARLREQEPDRDVAVQIEPGLVARADARLARVLMENLIQNAWKFTRKRERAEITIGARGSDEPGEFFVRDNGAGFDPRYADKLFAPFQRLHTTREFPGTGIGLATVKRIVTRHGGSIAASSASGEGATFSFSLGGITHE